MSSPQDAVRILFAYVKQTQNPRVRMDNLRVFADKFARKFAEDYPDIADLSGDNNGGVLERHLAALEQDKKVELEREPSGAIKTIFFPAYYALEIQRWYTKVQDDRTIPLPSEEDLGFNLPVGTAEIVDISVSFMEWLGNDKVDQDQIVRLRFPHGIREGIATVGIINGPLAVVAFSRVREYLRSGQNASYMSTRVRGALHGKELAVHEMMQQVLTKPEEAMLSIREPNEFQFLFWTQLASAIVKEYAEKTDRMESEHAFCQGAYLLGYYSVFFKGKHQRVMEYEAAIKGVEDQLKEPPYLYSLQDVYGFADKKGVPLLKRLDKEAVNALLNNLMTPAEGKQVAQLVAFNTPKARGLMIHSTQYIPMTLRKLATAAKTAREQIIAEMTEILYAESSTDWMNGDAAFERYLSSWVEDYDPILFAMLNFQLLFLIADGQELPSQTRDAVFRLFDRTKRDMMPYFRMLELDREDLLQEARLRLPLWMIIPILRGFVRLFRALFGGSKKRNTGAAKKESNAAKAPSTADQRKEFKAQITALAAGYLADGQTMDQRLNELHREWNPVLDKAAAKNLIADVNSLCRDTMRKMKVGGKVAPSKARVQEVAKRIAQNSTFERIKKRQAFQEYLELYMLSVLGK